MSNYSLFTRIPIDDGELSLAELFIAPADQLSLLTRLRNTLAWRQDNIQMFGRQTPIPRLQAWYGDPGCNYRYSGLSLSPQPWTEELQALRDQIATACQHPFNAVLANLYRDGQDSVGWHADNEPELGPNPLIASLSLGAERRFSLRHRQRGTRVDLTLTSGSLLLMAGPLQHHWQHALPKTRQTHELRINLSFRWLPATAPSPVAGGPLP